MLALLLLPLLADLPRESGTSDHVALIEINHYHCPETGAELGVQVIYWDWHDLDCTHHVVAWRMLHARRAIFRRIGDEWRETWHDDARHEIHARRLRETWTIGDPEVADREGLPAHLRRGIGGRK